VPGKEEGKGLRRLKESALARTIEKLTQYRRSRKRLGEGSDQRNRGKKSAEPRMSKTIILLPRERESLPYYERNPVQGEVYQKKTVKKKKPIKGRGATQIDAERGGLSET